MPPGAGEESCGLGLGSTRVHKWSSQSCNLPPALPFLAIFTSFRHYFAVQGEVAGGDFVTLGDTREGTRC